MKKTSRGRVPRRTGSWMLGLAAWAACASAAAQVVAAPPAAPAPTADGVPDADSLPMTKTVVNRGTLDKEIPQDGYEALKNVAGVSNASAKGTISDNLNIRGIQLDTYSSYRLNGGVSLVNIIGIPSENKDRIEALKGANALMFGIASPAGIVNLVTKRATAQDVSTVGLSANAFGQYAGNVDLGRRFGEGRQFGLRVNGALAHLETGVDGGSGHSRFGSLAADWNGVPGLGVKLDYENYSRDVIEQSQIQQIKPVNGVIAVPRVPDPTRLLSGPWAHYRPEIENLQLRVDYAIGRAWGVMAEAGRSEGQRDRYISRINGYDVTTGEGVNNITIVRGQRYVNTFHKVEAVGRFDTGGLGHLLTFGVMSAERDANTPSVTTLRMAQNIYEPRELPAPPVPTGPITYSPQVAKNVGLYVYDTVSLGEQWKLLVGVRRTRYDASNTLANGDQLTTVTTKMSPALGAIYQLSPGTAVYASFMKGLEETGTAPVGTTNQLTFLPPEEATQKEIGVRSEPMKGIALTAAYFDITRGNALTDVQSNTYLIDGTTHFRGLEASVNAELGKQWTLNFGGLWMKAEQDSVLDQSIKGLTPENTPRFAGNLSVTHKLAAVQGLSLTAGASYNGRRYINPQNQGEIPAVTVYSAGISYATRIGGRRASLQMNIDNLSDKRYWTSASGGAYGIGMVRNFKFSAKYDF